MFGKHTTLLGIMLGQHSIAAVVLERNGTGPKVVQEHTFPMTLDLLKDAPELVGQELRGHLQDAGISCRRCLVCIPEQWLFSTEVHLPELDAADEASFLRLQAERNLPMPAEDLAMAVTRYPASESERGATLFGLPMNHIQKLLTALHTAHLQPVSITLAASALCTEPNDQDALAVCFAPHHAVLVVTTGGSVQSIRILNYLKEDASDVPAVAKQLFREIRITLGQMDETVRNKFTALTVYGSFTTLPDLVEALREPLESLELHIAFNEANCTGRDATMPGLTTAASRCLAGEVTALEFLPEQPSRIKAVLAPILKRRTASLMSAAALGIFLLTALFIHHGHTASTLEAEWAAIEPDMHDAQLLQERVSTYTHWFDDSTPSLRALLDLTEAFPEEGAVWLRNLSIKGGEKVVCSGSAMNNAAWLHMLETLKSNAVVSGLQVSQVRGDTPVDFSFDYHWNREVQQ